MGVKPREFAAARSRRPATVVRLAIDASGLAGLMRI
jgi:hypothetical protein